MLWNCAAFVSAALLVSQAQAGQPEHDPETTCESDTATHSSYVTTTYKTKTDYSTTTHLVEVTVPYAVNSTVTSIKTKVVESYITECITTTLYFTDLVTNTKTGTAYETNTLTDSVTVTDTDSVTITGTAYATITETDTTTATVPTTTYTTETIFSTTFNPCPTQCSVSAETVNLYFWPSDRPHSYPSTWVDESLDYTFTYPSVYMLVPTAAGVNNASQLLGPQTTNWIIPLDLTEVSTIVGSTATVQLELSDLSTDCPKSVAPSAIATMAPDPHCNPILAAPSEVSSWAYPCNACGQFGLFDPPYAAPTLTGPLVEPTATTTTSEVVIVPTETTEVSSSTLDVPPVPLPMVTEASTIPLPSFTDIPPAPMPTVSSIPPVPMPTVSSSIPPAPMPTVSSIPPISLPSVTESTTQPIPTAGAANVGVAMGSLLSVFLIALAL
ncbi:uncharacterized protein B0I36DRAFT_389425 [Microdochium trichocladiopsis]|uniref:Uncharacterized protein n=1 Tax=Microdochium trichocladiopsis TaxID=1682393 RepID=A0A9P9BJE8_9PEZI|nr:uncharacterized protein B0I36DRAFT_389425 [Microdochium trichocladiopsis]KAH7014566.1 hypothetical protein B0I36DRAFT_389425 [Microdochium trichocladiopsis]